MQYIFVPQYESLTVEEIWRKVNEYPLYQNFFPEERDLDKLPRQWICNVAYTLIGEEFQSWVKA